jgi:hypothetical protein
MGIACEDRQGLGLKAGTSGNKQMQEGIEKNVFDVRESG